MNYGALITLLRGRKRYNGPPLDPDDFLKAVIGGLLTGLGVIFIAWFLTGCFTRTPEAPKTLSVGRVVTYWAEEAIGGNAAVEAGCALWWPLVYCQALPRDRADIWFVESNFSPDRIVGEAHRGVVYLAPGLPEKLHAVRIAHELGHELGAAHVPGKAGKAIMNPVLSEVPAATVLDVISLFQGNQKL